MLDHGKLSKSQYTVDKQTTFTGKQRIRNGIRQQLHDNVLDRNTGKRIKKWLPCYSN